MSSSPNIVADGPDLKPQHEDTGLGGSIAKEGQVKHSMRGILFLLFLAGAGLLFVIFAVTTART